MNNVGSVSVKRLVQWSSSGDIDRLRINDAYPRINTAWTIQDKGKYLYSVLHGVDTSIITINVTARDSYIVDGASRLSVLSDFQQGKLPMVVEYSKMPDRISFRPYAVPPSAYKYDRFVYEADTLVEAHYDGLQADQQRSFLQAKVDVRKYCDMSLEDEKQLYWQTNYVCPASPSYTSEYDEAEEYADVASLLSEEGRGILRQILHLIGGVHRNMACAELLQFLRKLLQRDASDTDHANRVDRLECLECADGAQCADGARNPAPAKQ
jgi:hypothetical protein